MGTLILISSPSGGGKTSVIHALLERVPNSARLLTTTTRDPRSGEQDGFDYHFVEGAEFTEKIKRGDFLEYVRYANSYYGIDRKDLEDALAMHRYVFAAIDTQGKQSLKDLGIPFFSIFLLPESMDVLKKRLAQRPDMEDADIEDRLKEAEREIEEAEDYDRRIVNRQGHFNETIEDIVRSLPE